MIKKIITPICTYLVLYAVLIMLPLTSFAQKNSESTFFTDKFDVNNPMEVDLVFNVKQFIKNKDSEDQSEAILRYKLEDGTEVEKAVLISRVEICEEINVISLHSKLTLWMKTTKLRNLTNSEILKWYLSVKWQVIMTSILSRNILSIRPMKQFRNIV